MVEAKKTNPAINTELNVKQKRFARLYAKTGNGTQSAIQAGYSPRTAGSLAVKLLANPAIAFEIDRFEGNRSARTDIEGDAVIFELARIGMSNALDYIDPKTGALVTDLRLISRDAAAAITDIQTETKLGPDGNPVTRARFKLAPKTPALELLGRQFGMFAKEVKHSGSVAVNMTQEEAEKRLIELEAKLIED